MSQAGIISVATSSLPVTVPTSFQTDSGIAVPAANVITFHGVGGIFSGAGSTVTFTVTGTGIPWTDEAVSFSAASNNGYFCTAAAIVATMPAAPVQGDIIYLISEFAGVVTLQANAGQRFRVGPMTSVLGGTCTSSALGDAIEFVYRAADATFICANSPQGTFTVT